jgi:hypothetical protein
MNLRNIREKFGKNDITKTEEQNWINRQISEQVVSMNTAKLLFCFAKMKEDELIAIVFNGSRIMETMNLDANYIVQIIVDKYFPELVDDCRIRKAIKQDTEEENLIKEKYERIAERKFELWKLYTLADIYYKIEQEKRKLENYYTRRKHVTTRNRFNKIISKRNNRFIPNKKLIKEMKPCPSPIDIFPNIQIDNIFYLGLSYKTWMLSKNIFEKQHRLNVEQLFKEFQYQLSITWK